VGQSELAIVGSADTTALVLVPESGDGVQVLKAGIMEIADLYVVNKADRPGADRLMQEIEIMLGIRRGHAYRHVRAHHGVDLSAMGRGAPAAAERAYEPDQWSPPVLRSVAVKGDGVDDLVDTFDRHHALLERTGRLAVLRRERLARHTREVVHRALSILVWDRHAGEERLAAGMDAVAEGRLSPYTLAEEIVSELREGSSNAER
jgi:LAO/AO transport system kinase